MSKPLTLIEKNSSGFTLLEVLISMLIIGLCTAAFLMFQTTSWSASNAASKTLSAGQLIEKQVEYLRMRIASNPTDTFPVLMAVGNTGTTTEKTITVRWVVANATDKNGAVMPNVRQVTFTAVWTAPRTDSIVVPTFIARNF